VQFSMLDFAHNTYLTVLAQTGLVGCGLVGFLVAVGWRKARAACRAGDWVGEAALLSFAGVGVCSMFGEVLLVPAILAAFLLIIMAAGSSREMPGADAGRNA
jgi:O-antigen ligase